MQKQMDEEGLKMAPFFAGKVTKTTRRREHDKGDINVTKDGKFISLLNESISTF